MKNESIPKFILNDQDGQSLVEFVLLVSVLALISLTLMGVVNGSVAKRWELLVEFVASPNVKSLNAKGEVTIP